MSKLKKVLNNQYTVGIVLGLVTAILSWITFDSVKKITSLILNKTIAFLNYRISISVLGLFIILLVLICLLLITKRISKSLNNSINNEPDFLQYREDKFGDLYFKWCYEKQYDGKYAISDISYYCPSCKCKLLEPSVFGELKNCPNCGFITHRHGLKIHSIEEVHNMILHRIENNMYLGKIS